VSENSAFCGACGAALSSLKKEIPDEEEEVTVPVYIDNITMPDSVDTSHVFKDSRLIQPRKKKNTLKIGIAGAVGVLAAIVVIAFVGRFFSSHQGNAYVYLSDGNYILASQLGGEAIQMASSRSDRTNRDMVAFSEDGKYVYYYTKYDGSTGSLCCAQYEKLKANSARNENYIKIIATNVALGFHMLNDGTLLYQNGSDTLYYYDGNTSNQIARSVSSYYTDDSNRVVYSTREESDSDTIYGISLPNVDDKNELASNVSIVYSASDFDHIIFERSTKESDDFEQSLYSVSFDGNSEKLGDNVQICYIKNDCLYFTAPSDKTLRLYDYVQDDYASSDAALSEPTRDQYSIPTYSYRKLRDTSDISAYSEIYTSCTKESSFYWSGFSYRSLEYAAKNSGSNAEVYQSFIEKYQGMENEDGYIVVTDAIREDLMTLAQICGKGDDGEWLTLCFYKEQTGTNTDTEAYNKALSAYNEARDRINIRKELQSRKNNIGVRTLYSFSEGTLTTVYENVLDVVSDDEAIVFNTVDMIDPSVDIDEVSSVNTIKNLFLLDYSLQNYVLFPNERTVCQLSMSAADALATAGDLGEFTLHSAGTNLFLHDATGALFVAETDGQSIGAFSLIYDDVSYIRGTALDAEAFYYYGDDYTNSGKSYHNLYRYSNGKAVKIAQDVMLVGVTEYTDGVVLGCTDETAHGYELTMFYPDGSSTLISDGVTYFLRVNDSTLLYITYYDLYCYDGENKAMVQQDVDYVWSKENMEISQIRASS